MLTGSEWQSPKNHGGAKTSSQTAYNNMASTTCHATTVAAPPLLQPAGSPWTPLGQSSSVVGTSTRGGTRTNLPADAPTSYGFDTTTAVASTNIVSRAPVDTFLNTTIMEDFILKPSSPTENATTESSSCGSLGADPHPSPTRDGSTRMHYPASSCRHRQQQRQTARVTPHIFVSPSPEETSDPEEQQRRRQERAREQQLLILERVHAAREERKAQQQHKVCTLMSRELVVETSVVF